MTKRPMPTREETALAVDVDNAQEAPATLQALGILPAAEAPANVTTGDAEGQSNADQSAETATRQRDVVIFCPYHPELQLKANRTEAYFTRYYCPDGACGYSQKVPRPDLQQRLERAKAAENDFSAR